MIALIYRFRLLEPVLVAQANSGEENSAISLSAIPGGTLRGALMARYAQDHPGVDLLRHPDPQKLFFSENVYFLNAYPWVENTRLLPKPLSLFTEKLQAEREDAEIWDFALASAPQPEPKQPHSPGGEFCKLANGYITLHSPARQFNVHISLQNPNRRGPENQVFRYDALAEGQVFEAVVLANEESNLLEIQRLLADDMRIGRAHTAGYGRIQIESNAIDPIWQEYEADDAMATSQFVITFLSPVIIRHRNGQTGGNINETLASELGLPETTVPVQASFRLRVAGGFNRKWALPMPQSWVVEAGSVFSYNALELSVADLRTRLAKGIGERRMEGFGRAAVNWQTRSQIKRVPLNQLLVSPPPLSAESRELAQMLAQRRLHVLLDQKLVAAINNARLSGPLPQNAQLNRVRTVVAQALVNISQHPNQVGLQPIREHLDGLRKRSRKQFENVHIAGVPLVEWIVHRVDKLDVEEQIWKRGELPRLAGEPATLTDALRREYTARLIEGVMKKASRQNQMEKTK